MVLEEEWATKKEFAGTVPNSGVGAWGSISEEREEEAYSKQKELYDQE